MKKNKPIGSTLRSTKSNKLNIAGDQNEAIPKLPYQPIDDYSENINQPQILPMGTMPVIYDPPFSYELAASAPCNKLKAMIDTVKNQMVNMQLVPEQYSIHEQWLSYAENRYNSSCVVVAQDPVSAPTTQSGSELPQLNPAPVEPPVVQTPVEETIDYPVKQPPIEAETQAPTSVPAIDEKVSIEDDLSVKTNEALPVEENAQPSADDKITAIQTLSTPPSTPFPMPPPVSAASAGSANSAAEKKKTNWFWAVVAATSAAGFLLFKPKP